MSNQCKKVRSIVLFILMLLTLCVPSNLASIQAAATTDRVPITCYTISTGRVNTYNLSGGQYSYTGYIDGATDKCVIQQVRQDGYCKVKYPVGRGYRTAYAQSSRFFINTNFSTGTVQLGARKTVYRRSNLSQSLGTVYADDKVIIIGTSGNTTQIIYPVSGGYKMGWVSGKYAAGGPQSVDLADGYYQIKSAINSNYVLDVYGASVDDEANIQIYHNCGTKNQGFIIRKQSDGYYTIEAIHSGKYLDVYKGQKINGANIIQYSENGGDNQKWQIVKTTDGYYSFISKINGLYMDVKDARAADEVNIQCHTANGSSAQKFILDSVTVDGKTYQQAVNGGNDNSSWDSRVGSTLADIRSTYYTTGNMSARAGYTGQCTWYAYGRFYERNNIALNYARHAKQWLSDNRNDSRVSVLYGAGQIRPNCIAVRTSGTYGHVMYIEHVSYRAGSPEYVYYTECNKDANGRYDAGVDCILKKKAYADFVSQDRPAGYIVAR